MNKYVYYLHSCLWVKTMVFWWLQSRYFGAPQQNTKKERKKKKQVILSALCPLTCNSTRHQHTLQMFADHYGWPKTRVRIRRYRIAECDTISTNCYAFAQNASQKARRIVFCENEWVIAPLMSVKNSCWSMFSKPKSSNFEAKNFVQLNIDRWLLHQNIAGKTPTI